MMEVSWTEQNSNKINNVKKKEEYEKSTIISYVCLTEFNVMRFNI